MFSFRFSALSKLLLALGCSSFPLFSQVAVTLATSPNPSKLGAPIALTATVAPASASGRITFYDGFTVLATRSLASGAVSFSAISLPTGARKLRAFYSGSGGSATSNIVTQVVNAQAGAAFGAKPPIKSPGDGGFLTTGADFNGDGHADIVKVFGESLLILMGDGSGNFQVGPTTSLSSIPGYVAIGDFNSDGKMDLALPIFNHVSILMGNGDGTFQQSVDYPIGSGRSIAVADINGDGLADLVVADDRQGVDVLLGKGDGTFQAAIASATTPSGATQQSHYVVVADFNGDGRADVAVTNYDPANLLTVMLGNGDGTFQPPLRVATPGQPDTLAVGDFNGDGKVDLVTSSADIFLGNGDGTFQKVKSYPGTAPSPGTGDSTTASLVLVRDFNADGRDDLIFTGTGIGVLLGNGDGSFQPLVNSSLGVSGSLLIAGEFNGDGRTDLAVVNYDQSLSILLGTTVTVTPLSGTPQSALKTTAFPSALQVVVKDGINPIGGIAVSFTAPTNFASAVLSSNSVVTDASGVAGVTATANAVAGSYQVTATALGVPAAFALTNLASTASVITSTPTLPQSTLLGTAFAQSLKVTLKDSAGLPVTGVEVQFAVPANGASAALSASSAITDASGTATVAATANNIRGSYLVTASADGLSASFSLTNYQPSGVTLSASSNPATFGSPLTLTATVTSVSPSGRVAFYDGVNLLESKPGLSGTVSVSTILLAAGTHQLTAFYRDELNYVSGTSNVVSEVVRAVPGGAFLPRSLPATIPATAAVDDFNGDGKADYVSYTSVPDFYPWWQVDLGASTVVGSVVVWNRTDCCSSRLSDYWVFISDTPFLPTDTPDVLRNRPLTFASHQTIGANPSAVISAGGSQGRYVRVQQNRREYLSLAEVQVFGPGAQASTNLALAKAASQSSTLPEYPTAGAAAAVDGNTNGDFFGGSVTSTDLATTSVAVVQGNGDGTFRTPVSYTPGLTSISGIAAGDFNTDGVADVAVIGTSGPLNQPNATLSVFLGNGDGTFRPAVQFFAGSLKPLSPFASYGATGSLALADFNSDGKLDAIVSYSVGTQCGSLICQAAGMYLLPGKGDGTFDAPLSYTDVGGSFVIADFNRDSAPDLALISIASYPFQSIAVPLLVPGNGDGTAGAAIGFSVGAGLFPSYLGTADLNGDGNADLVASGTLTPTSGAASPATSVLLGDGKGGFQTATIDTTGSVKALGDFNGDGALDLVVTDFAGNISGIVLGNGDGTFRSGSSLFGTAPLAVADFNGDGRADILTANAVLLGTGSVSVSLTATGGTPQSTPTNSNFSSPLRVELRNNGIPLSGAVVHFAAPATGATASLSSSTAITDASGTASVTARAQSTPGNYVVTATYPGAAASFFLTNTGYSFLVATGGTPQSVSVGLPFAHRLEATVKDAAGNPVSGAFISFTAPGSGPSAILSDGSNGTDASGVASVLATANNIAGSYLVTASVGGLTAVFSLTNMPSGVPASISATAGTPQSTVLRTSFPNILQATVKDASGNPVSGVSVTFMAPTNGASASLSPVPAVTNASGVASVGAGANGIAGSYTVTASAGALSTSFSLTNLSNDPAGSGNLAVGKPATQSSTLAGYASAAASSAVDGNIITDFFGGSVTHTNYDPNAWWQVDLGESISVDKIVIWNRTDCCSDRLSDYWVFVSDTPFGPADTPGTLQGRPRTFAIHQTSVPNPSTSISAGGARGRYVRVQLTGTGNLSLAEVEVMGTNSTTATNLATGKTATQSSTLSGYSTASASSAVDSNTNGNFFNGSVTHTNADPNAWWQVDLGASATVNSVVIWNRTDCCGDRLSDYWVFVSDTPFGPSDTPATLQNRAGVFAIHQSTAPNPSTTVATTGAQGRYVRVQLSGVGNLSLAEVQVLGTGATPAATNLAAGRAATQSSTLPGYSTAGASSAVDSNTGGNFFSGSVTHTNADPNAWWQVDLGASATINSVVVWNRTDCCADRLSDYWVFVSDAPFSSTDTPSTLQGRPGIFAIHQTTAPNLSASIAVGKQGRYVRVQLSGTNSLSLAEVQVIGTGGSATSNVAAGKSATQSSTLPGYATAGPGAAVDGSQDGNFFAGSVTHTNTDANAWWQVDLGTSKSINSVVIWNRTDCCSDRLTDYWVFVSDTPFTATDTPATLQSRASTFNSHQSAAPNPSVTIPVGMQGRYVRVQLSGTNNLSLAEVQVFGQ